MGNTHPVVEPLRKWLSENEHALDSITLGEPRRFNNYLENRIRAAFQAGWDACERHSQELNLGSVPYRSGRGASVVRTMELKLTPKAIAGHDLMRALGEWRDAGAPPEQVMFCLDRFIREVIAAERATHSALPQQPTGE